MHRNHRDVWASSITYTGLRTFDPLGNTVNPNSPNSGNNIWSTLGEKSLRFGPSGPAPEVQMIRHYVRRRTNQPSIGPVPMEATDRSEHCLGTLENVFFWGLVLY